MRALATGLSVVLLLAGASSAEGALVELRDDGRSSVIVVTALPGEQNRITAFATSVGGTLRAEIEDAGARPTAGAGCTQAGTETVHCATPGIPNLEIDAGDGDDAVIEEGTFLLVSIVGGGGDDTLRVFNGGHVSGGPGDDRLRGSPGPDNFAGDEGEDVLDSRGGRDNLEGGDGGDILRGGPAIDSMNGGNGFQPGKGARDRIFGGRGNDYLDDDDDQAGVIGPDHLDGGPGRDTTFSYYNRRRPVGVNLGTGKNVGERGERDTLRKIEVVWAGRKDDVLLGTGANEGFEGNSGSDVIRARGGDDVINATEHDRISAGPGDDTIHGNDFEVWNGRASCGPGRDELTSYFWQYGRSAGQPEEKAPGPLIEASCEAIPAFEGLTVDPVPRRTGARELTFRFQLSRGLDFALTEPTRPFHAIASRVARDGLVSIRLPRDVEDGAPVRAVVTRRQGPVEWRFAVPRRPAG